MSKAALVTGSAKRVGRAIALYLAECGYDIALHCNHSLAEAEQAKQEIEALGRKAEIFQFDLVNTEALEGHMASVVQRFSDLELLVNNASIFEREKFQDSDVALYQRHMAVNATAPIFLTQAFAKYVKSGHVVNLLDADIVKHHGSHFFYLLSKKTLAEFTKMAARDLGPNIRVNAICVGSALPSDQNPPGYEEKLTARLPLQQLGNVDDILQALDYLRASARTTGQLLFPDSGQHLL